MNCDHRLTPDPRSGIRFCAKCGMDERKVGCEQKKALTAEQIDDAILDTILAANLNPRLCVVHSADLIALGRAVWARATAPAASPAPILTDEEKADCGLLSELGPSGVDVPAKLVTHCPWCAAPVSVADEPYCANADCRWNNGGTLPERLSLTVADVLRIVDANPTRQEIERALIANLPRNGGVTVRVPPGECRTPNCTCEPGICLQTIPATFTPSERLWMTVADVLRIFDANAASRQEIERALIANLPSNGGPRPHGTKAAPAPEPKLICPTCGIDRYKEGCSRYPCGFLAVASGVSVVDHQTLSHQTPAQGDPTS